METMTKKEAIRYHIEKMPDVDLINLVRDIYMYDGSYDSWAFCSMDEFNELHSGMEPLDIAREVEDACGDFCVACDYFYYDCSGVLCSCDEDEAADLIRTNCMTDLINDFMKGRYSDYVESYDYDLADIIDSTDDDAIFDNKGNEIIE